MKTKRTVTTEVEHVQRGHEGSCTVVKSAKIDPATIYPFDVAENDPSKSGRIAGKPFHVGTYEVYPTHSRFGIVWFVERPVVGVMHLVRTEPTFALAIKGLRL